MIWKKHSRKTFLAAAIAAGVLLTWSLSAFAAKSPQVPIAGSAIPQFTQALPLLSVQPGGTLTTTVGNGNLTLRMCEFQAKVLPLGTIAGTPGAPPAQTGTWVWGYLVDETGTSTCAQLITKYGDSNGMVDTYIGPVIVNQRGSSTNVTYVNSLPDVANFSYVDFFWKYSTDQTLHWADPTGREANECDKLVNSAGFPGGTTYPPYNTTCAQNYVGPIPTVPHLHGGEVPPELDGGPDAWFTSDGAIKGHGYYTYGLTTPPAATPSALYKYPNVQEAAPIWFHDHVLGATRLNVYAGLAGAYYIDDPAMGLPTNLQPIASVIPLVIQDRMFDTNGQLFFPGDSAGNVLWSINPEHPYWVPEFVGDTIVVNGKAWPFVNVEAKRYRFLILNGSNARTYELSIPNGPTMYVISTDGGYLDSPAPVNKLVIMPGERYEVIIDFGKFAKKNLIMSNTARTPYPKGAPPRGSTLGNVVKFVVGAMPAVADASYNPAAATAALGGGPLRTGAKTIVRLANPATGTLATGVTANLTRQLTLNEVLGPPKTVIDPVTGVTTAYPGGPLEILVNNTGWSGKIHGTNVSRGDFQAITTGTGTTGQITSYYSELPNEGSTEVWELVNLTADAHPIHLHLAQFQIINRQNFNVSNYNSKAYFPAFTYGPTGGTAPPGCAVGVYCPGYGPPLNYQTGNVRAQGGNPDITPYLQDGIYPPLPHEQGWKDTVVALPGMVTRLVVRWAPTDIATTAAASALYYPFNPDGIDSNQPGHGYVWHCHIIDHEDNEMMRPDVVILNPAAIGPASRPLVKGTAY